MRCKKLIPIFVFIIFCSAQVFSQTAASSDANQVGDDVPVHDKGKVKRRFGRGYMMSATRGVGIVVGAGISKSTGSINYESLTTSYSSDHMHNDGRKNALSFSVGVRYSYSVMMLLGFGVSLTYNRLGCEIGNSYNLVGGAENPGFNEVLKLDYLILKPYLRVGVLALGFYLGYLLKAGLGDNNVSDKFKKFDFGMTVGLDFTFPTRKKNAFSVILEGMFGFVNIYSGIDRTYRNLGFQLKVAYIFGFLN